MQRTTLGPALRRGVWVFIVLVVLTIVEYILALAMKRGNLPYMIVMNIVDAGLIAYFFMHIAQIRHLGREE
jgi:cytochrome c oxidase subunit IV